MKIIGVIPARYGSERFPGKPLADIHGKPMIVHVCEKATACSALDEVVVATDDARIQEAVLSHGFEVAMTSDQHRSGTDRCGEVIAQRSADVVINIQGDEPFINPDQIHELAQQFDNPDCEIATLAKPISDLSEIENPNRVKVVLRADGRALYFSRSKIPSGAADQHLRHIGLYGYRRETLIRLCQLSPSKLELSESLEQLRWLENGYDIWCGITDHESPSVDTPEDLKKLLEIGS